MTIFDKVGSLEQALKDKPVWNAGRRGSRRDRGENVTTKKS